MWQIGYRLQRSAQFVHEVKGEIQHYRATTNEIVIRGVISTPVSSNSTIEKTRCTGWYKQHNLEVASLADSDDCNCIKSMHMIHKNMTREKKCNKLTGTSVNGQCFEIDRLMRLWQTQSLKYELVLLLLISYISSQINHLTCIFKAPMTCDKVGIYTWNERPCTKNLVVVLTVYDILVTCIFDTNDCMTLSRSHNCHIPSWKHLRSSSLSSFCFSS